MTATNTTNKSLSEPASGDLNWDVNLNANFTTIDKAFGSFVNIATTTGNYALTTSDLQNMCFKSNTSAFTGNVTFTIPNGVAGQWVVVNQSGVSSNTLSVVCGASSVLVDRGTVRSIYCDGTTVSYADTPFATAGSNTQVIYNSSGALTGSANLKFNGTALLANAILDASGGNTATINGITPAFSSQAQAQAGTDNTTMMTPLRVSQGITTSPVLAATAGAAAGDVGTYMFAYPNNTTNYATGATIAGSLLLPGGSFTYDATSGSASSQSLGSAQAGTWRCMGNRVFGSGQHTITLWLRIS